MNGGAYMQDKNKNGLNITIDVQPQDSYAKARNDLLKAIDSINKLTPAEQQRLATELFGIERVAVLYRMLQNFYG